MSNIRKMVFIGVLLITFIIFILMVCYGFKLGPIKLMSYDEIEEANSNRKELLSELNDKNTNEYESKKVELEKTVQEYETTKNIYNRLVPNDKIADGGINKFVEIYDFNSLWEMISNYAKKNKVELNFDISQSNTMSAISSDYKICDLQFDAKGEYIDITSFIYSLEDDDILDFEISDFELKNENDNLEASFTVKEVAISSDSINK